MQQHCLRETWRPASTPHHNRFSHVLPLQKLKLLFQNCRILKVITRIVHCARTFRQNRELSGESDVYSLIYLIIKVYPLFKFKAMPSKGLLQVVSTRPSTMEVKSALCATFQALLLVALLMCHQLICMKKIICGTKLIILCDDYSNC